MADLTSAGTKLPPWQPPSPESITHNVGLKIMNSLTRAKDPFITMDGSKRVRWYMCGPTVYAPSHMGHARTYLGFDIIRRILQDFFNYDVSLIMNITDIDDKIIDRSKEQGIHHLELSQKFELEFHQDMELLGVAPPNVLTRVTEYMDEITAYIKQIVDKGLAYESNGSVYFYVTEFEQSEGMHYCKLAPEQIHNAALLAEGEGKLTQDFVSDKKSPRDFALWKKSKDGEPSWDSPWGPGRPGWHIECSVMASDILEQMGDDCRMDIHSGGIDLKFPHHDNEMAQAEAHSGCTQWVNYFVHAGHLHIQGFKMSKSLKNFITIRQALEHNTARQIRLCFLLHKYNAPMDYGDNTMSHAMITEKVFKEFFLNVKVVLREGSIAQVQKWTPETKVLARALQDAQTKIDAALRDDFDTPTVISTLIELVKATNVYIELPTTVHLVVHSVASYITRIFKIFGLLASDEIGFDAGGATGNREDTLAPVLDALMDFRSAVRDKARAKDTTAVLQECDGFRDDVLPKLGIRLEDKTGKSVWKLADPEELLREKEQRDLELARKEEEKAKAASEKAMKDALNSLSPEEFMKKCTLEDGTTLRYSQFGEDGLPTHDSNGEVLNKNQAKKAAKEFSAQQKKYEKYMEKQNA
jgi:cysteinyl-tRNA synthetase